MSKTTILLESETRQLLRRIGRKEQTYDDLIRELAAKHNVCIKCGGTKESLSGSGFAPAPRQPAPDDVSDRSKEAQD